jgi:hypothetical protein
MVNMGPLCSTSFSKISRLFVLSMCILYYENALIKVYRSTKYIIR